jgi:glycosyltransferase involved in cell wall biosynthesis
MVNREARNWSSAETELWTFMPSGVDFAGCFNEKKLVYYCPDDWSKFSTYDATWMTYCENTLLQKANVVFATSRFLESKFHPLAGNRVHYMPHGVNHAHFATALASETIIPDEIIHLPKPVIGFYGNIYDWIDFDLLAKLAQERPQWSFVMIGPLYTNISRFADVPNVYFLGRREQRCLPPYCKGFDAAIIPYKLTDPRMESVNPVKMRELLAAGVPIAASDLPEARRVSEHVITARTVPEFLAALEIHLENSRCDPQLRNKISDERKSDDWRIKVQQIRSIVEQS